MSIERERERLKEMQNLMKQVHESVLAGKSKFDLSEWVQGKVSENTPPQTSAVRFAAPLALPCNTNPLMIKVLVLVLSLFMIMTWVYSLAFLHI